MAMAMAMGRFGPCGSPAWPRSCNSNGSPCVVVRSRVWGAGNPGGVAVRNHCHHRLEARIAAAAAPRRSFASAATAAPATTDADVKTSLVIRVADRPGALEDVLRVFRESGINLTRIESRPVPKSPSWDVFLDVEGRRVPFHELQTGRARCEAVQELGPRSVPWFPRRLEDLDSFRHKTLDAGTDLDADHPGFRDATYRARRDAIVVAAREYREGMEIPRVVYTEDELNTWSLVYGELRARYASMACKEYLTVLGDLERDGVYARTRIPQLEDVSRWLNARTGFRLRPVGGLLSSRDFLNGLAFRVFHSTQYMRHPSKPLYTPEPDAVHELMGHVPMLGDESFAALSQEVGLASLGASDHDIRRLATLYWFTVEFGLVREPDGVKAYGAGLLSSFGELEHACQSDKPERAPFDPQLAADTPYPITTFQPTYFVADSIARAFELTREFCEDSIRRPFYVRYDAASRRVVLDRAIRRAGSAAPRADPEATSTTARAM